VASLHLIPPQTVSSVFSLYGSEGLNRECYYGATDTLRSRLKRTPRGSNRHRGDGWPSGLPSGEMGYRSGAKKSPRKPATEAKIKGLNRGLINPQSSGQNTRKENKGFYVNLCATRVYAYFILPSNTRDRASTSLLGARAGIVGEVRIDA
jgi:hypothetical protein